MLENISTESTIMKTLLLDNRTAWRAWLAANHDQESEIWLVYYKKMTGKTCIEYGASVEEALCYGWVDSLIKRLDSTKYARKFTPRSENSQWSPCNIKRVEQLISAGLMTEHGLAKVKAAKRTGSLQNPVSKPKLKFEMHPDFAVALSENKRAQKTFRQLAPTYQKQFLGWIEVAVRPETKQKRIQESIRLLSAGKKLGLK
jgi:uncharacterized protein YdeI (YjbR/CyaY-like superfamily)